MMDDGAPWLGRLSAALPRQPYYTADGLVCVMTRLGAGVAARAKTVYRAVRGGLMDLDEGKEYGKGRRVAECA